MIESLRTPGTPVEDEPTLPEDPAEAARYLEGLWKERGGWPKAQTEVERSGEAGKRVESSKGFAWLAEQFDSEMMWVQSSLNTNYGTILCFNFGYNTGEYAPNAYIFNPGGDDRLVERGILIYEHDGAWKKRPLSEVHKEWLSFN